MARKQLGMLLRTTDGPVCTIYRVKFMSTALIKLISRLAKPQLMHNSPGLLPAAQWTAAVTTGVTAAAAATAAAAIYRLLGL
jgi:hypothetical protein